MTPDEKVTRIQQLIGLISEGITRKEFVTSFENVVKSVKASEARLTSYIHTTISSALSDMNRRIDAKLSTVKDGTPGKDGTDYVLTETDKSVIASLIEVPIVKETTIVHEQPVVKEVAVYEPAEDIRNRLELLEGDERLDASAIKGIDSIWEKIKELAARPSRGQSPMGPMLYVGGTKKGRANSLNFVAGSGVTISYAYANGRNDVTITATGSASLTPITVTGTVDDSNKAFVAASTPNVVIINGASYRHGHGVTISGLNITTDNAVGSGGDIYCL